MTLLIAISVLFGLCAGLIVWSMARFYLAVPDEDRMLLDRPPLGFRLLWPAIRVLDHYGKSLYRQSEGERINRLLTRAGLEYTLTSSQFQIGKQISAILWGVIAWIGTLPLGAAGGMLAIMAVAVGYLLPELWLRESVNKREKQLVRDLPFYLDIITLAVEAGTNLTGGITQAVKKSSDSPLRDEFKRVLRDVRAGKSRSEALRGMSERCDTQAIHTVLGSMIQAEKSGSSLGTVLRAQAGQLRVARFQRAEKLAMEAPVKLLLPLVAFIFPTTFLVLGFVILGKAIDAGLISWKPLLFAWYWPR